MLRVEGAGEETRALLGIDSKRLQYYCTCKCYLIKPYLSMVLTSITKSGVVKLVGRVSFESSCNVKTNGQKHIT